MYYVIPQNIRPNFAVDFEMERLCSMRTMVSPLVVPMCPTALPKDDNLTFYPVQSFYKLEAFLSALLFVLDAESEGVSLDDDGMFYFVHSYTEGSVSCSIISGGYDRR